MATMATTVEDNGNDYFAACLRFQCSDCDCVWSKATMAKHGGRRRYCFIGKCAGGATYWQRRWRSAYLLLALASSSAGLVHWPPFQPFQLNSSVFFGFRSCTEQVCSTLVDANYSMRVCMVSSARQCSQWLLFFVWEIKFLSQTFSWQ